MNKPYPINCLLTSSEAVAEPGILQSLGNFFIAKRDFLAANNFTFPMDNFAFSADNFTFPVNISILRILKS